MTETGSRTYDICGLRLCTEIPLDGLAPSGQAPDAMVTVAASRDIPRARPTEEVVAELIGPDGWPRYSFCRGRKGATLGRVYGMADFDISADLRSIVCSPAKGVDPALVGLLLAGTIPAYLLSAASVCVLHASSVELRSGAAVAFVGPSTQGKTTAAAMLCSVGHPVIGDDLLRIDFDDEGLPRCRGGAPELRLRAGQRSILQAFSKPPAMRETVDGRLAIKPAGVPDQPSTLAALVRPIPARGAIDVTLKRLAPTEAALLAGSTTRIEGWRRPEDLTRVLGQSAKLAESVPAFEAHIPWDMPFAPRTGDALASALLSALDNAHRVHTAPRTSRA